MRLGAVGLLSVLVRGAFAATSSDANNNLLDGLQPVNSPSVMADSPVFRDFQVQPAGDNAPAAAAQIATQPNAAAGDLMPECTESAWCVSFGAVSRALAVPPGRDRDAE